MSKSDPRPTVPLEALRAACLVRAFEEADPEARVLAAIERRRCTRSPSEAPEDFVARRAVELSAILRERSRGAEALLAASRASLPSALLVSAAFLAGAATNALATRLVSVLAFPLLGALIWNLAVYAGLAVHALRRARPSPTQAPHAGPAERLARALASSRVRRALSGDAREVAAVAGVAAGNFARHWVRAARPWIVASTRRALHLGAAALATGMLAGMYLRGLAFEYRATWESTFLDARTVEVLLAAVLAPASWVSGVPIPDVAALRVEGSGDAAPWIHLWAWTALLFAILPRLALAWLDGARARRLARGLPLELDDAYHRRLLAPGGGAGERVEVVPYALELDARAGERLRGLLHELFGARAEVLVRPACDYGAEPADLAPSSDASALVAVFALAQTPELEVHARLLEELRAGLRPDQRLLVVVDSSGYAARLGADETARARLDERRRAWHRAAREARLVPLHLELARDLDAGALARAGAALAPAAERAS